MQNRGEKDIDLIYHTQIVPIHYTIDNSANTIIYRFTQKLNINTVNLTQFSFYNAFPNINQFYNQFQIQIGGSTYLVIIPSTYYSFWNIFDLLTILNTQTNAQITGFGTWTFSLTGNNNKFVQITNSTNTPFRFVLSEQLQYNQVCQYIGIGRQSAAYQSFKSVQIAEFPYNVQTTNNLHVCCKNIQLNTEVQSCLATIPVNEPILNLIQYTSPFYQCNRHIITKNNSYGISEIVLSFIDDQGFPLIMNNNRVSCVLMWESYVK